MNNPRVAKTFLIAVVCFLAAGLLYALPAAAADFCATTVDLRSRGSSHEPTLQEILRYFPFTSAAVATIVLVIAFLLQRQSEASSNPTTHKSMSP